MEFNDAKVIKRENIVPSLLKFCKPIYHFLTAIFLKDSQSRLLRIIESVTHIDRIFNFLKNLKISNKQVINSSGS